MNIIEQKCAKCKVLLPYTEYQIKRTGRLYKVCNKCRKVSPEDSDKIDVNNLTRTISLLTREVEALKERIDGYEHLDHIGNVYLQSRPPELFTVSDLMMELGVPPEFFDMRYWPMMSVEAYNSCTSRRGYLTSISRHLSKHYLKEHDKRAERVKTYRRPAEITSGRSSTGCLYPIEYREVVKSYMNRNPLPEIVRRGSTHPK